MIPNHVRNGPRGHPEVKQLGSQVIGVVMYESHWTPLVLVPHGDILHMRTWDAPQNDHTRLNQVLMTLSQALGFSSMHVSRLHRMFFTTQLCGALAMGFLLYSLLDIMLPTSHDDAVALQQKLRENFSNALASSRLVQRPWIWGAGDEESDWPPAMSDTTTHQQPVQTGEMRFVVVYHMSVSRLMNVWNCFVAKGRCWEMMRCASIFFP